MFFRFVTQHAVGQADRITTPKTALALIRRVVKINEEVLVLLSSKIKWRFCGSRWCTENDRTRMIVMSSLTMVNETAGMLVLCCHLLRTSVTGVIYLTVLDNIERFSQTLTDKTPCFSRWSRDVIVSAAACLSIADWADQLDDSLKQIGLHWPTKKRSGVRQRVECFFM